MDFLKKKRDFVDLIIKHIGTSAIMDLLLRLLTCIEPLQPRQEVLNVSSQAAWAGCGVWVGSQGWVVRVWETGVGGQEEGFTTGRDPDFSRASVPHRRVPRGTGCLPVPLLCWLCSSAEWEGR